jgi:hypothetical protein
MSLNKKACSFAFGLLVLLIIILAQVASINKGLRSRDRKKLECREIETVFHNMVLGGC